MNTTTQTTDERCAMLARDAMALAYRVATFKPMGRFNDPQMVRDLADQIIMERCRESMRDSSLAIEAIYRARYGI